MFCKACEYPLWNISARQCPECGAGFRPSDFEFMPRAVRFCCPHCNQHYFGTDAKGLLQPSEFDCVSCGRHIAMDEMVLLPAEGWKEDQTRGVEVPWLRRKKIGFWAAWFGTIAMAMTQPGRLIRALPVEGQSRRALWFALLTNFCFLFVAVALGWVVVMVIGIIFSPSGSGGGAGFLSGAAFMTGFMTLIPMVFFALALFLWAVAAHVILRVTGPTRYGARRTFDALCYANGANILAAIPCFGSLLQMVAWVWSGVSAAIMLRETHRVSGLRAAVAVFLPPVGVIVAAVAIFAAVLSSGVSQMSGSWSHMQRVAPAEQAARAVRRWAGLHNGELPRHAVEMVEDGSLTPMSFGGFPFGGGSDATINGVDITQMFSLMRHERRTAVERVLSVMPEGMVAHRVGDLVFIYHGMTLSQAVPTDPTRGGLWLVVGFSRGGRSVAAARVDGSTDAFDAVELAGRVVDQNVLRTGAGLAALPDLTQVTAEAPARGR